MVCEQSGAATASRPRKGRPPAMPPGDRRRLLLGAAESVFIGRGYHAATMDDVAQAAGMSKKTVYQLVGSKSALFEAMLNETFQPVVPAPADPGEALAAALTALLREMVASCLSPRHVELMRLMIAEAPQSRDMADALDRLIGNGVLDKWLAHQVELGRLTAHQVRGAVSRFFCSVVLDELFHRLLAISLPEGFPDAEDRIGRAVEAFLSQPREPGPD